MVRAMATRQPPRIGVTVNRSLARMAPSMSMATTVPGTASVTRSSTGVERSPVTRSKR